jgi:NAD(P)H dehydrogenase (quinone)
MQEILVLYDSNNGATKQLAELVARGINSIDDIKARIRTVPKISAICESTAPNIPESGAPYVELNDLHECVGLALGSPVHFGNMSANLKYFFDSTSHEWLSGTLSGKPATVFTSCGSLHGGQESCLLSMILPLLHHGMLIAGIPYDDTTLMTTKTGGTPYGASHYDGMHHNMAISADEKKLAILQGKRLAEIAKRLRII